MKVNRDIDFEFVEELTVDVIAKVLDIPKDSAAKMLDNKIVFEERKLERLAEFKGLSVEEVIRLK